jgi:hypothetical protein
VNEDRRKDASSSVVVEPHDHDPKADVVAATLPGDVDWTIWA